MTIRGIASAVCLTATVFVTGLWNPAAAATVNDIIDFNSGSTTGSSIKTYIEDGYKFFDVRIVGGPCAFAGADKCAALNKHETTILTRVDGGVFDFTSIWFYLNGKVTSGSNALSIFDTNNIGHVFNFIQPAYLHNTGYTELLDFIGVTSITFESGGSSNTGNARFDVAMLSHFVPSPVPLPASALMLIAALGGIATLRRSKLV